MKRVLLVRAGVSPLLILIIVSASQSARKLLNRLRCAVVILSSLFALSLLIAGCGSGSHRTLFVIASGTPSIGAFDIAGSGALTLNTSNTFSTGSNPQAIVVDSQRRFAYVLNNAGPSSLGAILQYSINRGKGTLAVIQAPTGNSGITGPVPPIPTGVSPVSMAIDSSAAFVFTANSGSDSVSVFSLDSTTGKLTEVAGSPFSTGAGSKPVSVVARGGSVFVANQGTSTIAAYTYSSTTGALSATGTPATAGANTTSIDADPAGKFLFAADGTANTVTTYSIGASGVTATTTSVAVGKAPSNVHVDTSGKYLYVANSGDNNISAFTIDGSGGLSAISGSPFTVGTAPSFITNSVNGSYLFVANSGSSNVSSFQVNNGGLSATSGSPFAAPGYTSPNGLASLD
jgi:6-phosphogluconolactonase